MLVGESAAAAVVPGVQQVLEQEPRPQSPPLPPHHQDPYSSCLASSSRDAPYMIYIRQVHDISGD